MAKVDNWVSYEEKYSEWFKKMMKLKELKDKGYPVYIYPSPPDERDFQFKDIMLSCMPLKKDFPSKISLHLSPLVLNQEDAPFVQELHWQEFIIAIMIIMIICLLKDFQWHLPIGWQKNMII